LAKIAHIRDIRKIQMIKLILKKSIVPFLLLSAAICILCTTEAFASAPQQPNTQTAVSPAEKESAIVARIAYYTITRGELEKRLMNELYPYDFDYYNENTEPVNARKVLLKMIAEKAMIIEARAQGYLDKDQIKTSIRRFSDRKLVNMLLQKHIEGKINVTEDEIAKIMQAHPKFNKERAKATIERAKANALLNQYYKQIYDKSDVKKLSQNYPRVIQIHERLLHHPKQRKVSWIQNSQVREELTEQEKNIVLAQYNSGKVTLQDWFVALCNIVPPRRPRNLNTPKGVGQLLERALRMPLMVSEAKSLGLDRNKDFLKEVRNYEDRRLLGEVMSAKRKELAEPTTDQILAYFAKNKESFGTPKSLKIDLIWCQNLETAKQAKAALESGKDFEAVRKQYSLEKEGKPFTTHPASEGLFWKDLWAGEPNQIIGPLKGFYRQGISWRIVKILEKTPGKEKPYSKNIEQRVKNRMMSKQNETLLDVYGQELLKKYPYQIFPDVMKDINPLNIP
jgi:hypothetical protein